jgi:hypothetical protein
MQWNNFNDAIEQVNYEHIPQGTIAKVRMSIRPGGYDDLEQGWSGGYATQNYVTGSVYLSCEYIILEGPYSNRRIWGLIGLYSPKGVAWANKGRAFIKGILNSAYNLNPKDISPEVQAKRCIKGIEELDGIEFLARIDLNKNKHNELKNEITTAITPDYKEYAEHMGTTYNMNHMSW